ncbi:MAG: RNA 2',3'-cyclic phosphodiesterase [Gammaproteobacteria bacterium]|nr:RNA 2',3'-cyclic phosphodiesterase [Gammaproteobacteria bacterium]
MTAFKRLFYAIWPDIDVKNQLVAVSRQIKSDKVVPPDNLHLTLLFLGQVDDKLYDALVIETNQLHHNKFSLELTDSGRFKRSGIFWLAPNSYPDELIKLVNNLSDLAVKNNIFIDDRPYRPHVTLARNIKSNMRINPPSIPWSVSNFCLVESKTLPQGANYQILHSWSLT